MKRKGPGRPKMAESKKAGYAVCMRLTSAQVRRLKSEAKSAELPISAYVRGLIFGFEEE